MNRVYKRVGAPFLNAILIFALLCCLCFPITAAEGMTDPIPCNVIYHEGTPPTCTQNGILSYYSCADPSCEHYSKMYADEALTQELTDLTAPATGHSHTYTNNGDTHTVTCPNCDYSATEGHSYSNGSCICGATEIIEPTGISIKFGYSVAFDSDLKMNYRIKLENIAAAIPNYTTEGAYLVVEKDQYFSDGTTGVDTQTLYAVLTDERMIFTLNGIQSVEMGSELRAVLHIFDRDGKEYVTPADSISILAYVQSFLDHAETNNATSLSRMLIDLLNYGAAAQVYFNRRADVLVNAGMDAYQQYATKELVEELNDTKVEIETNAPVQAVDKISFSVNFDDKTEIFAKLSLAEGWSSDDITCVKVFDAYGEEMEVLTELEELSDGKLQVVYDDVNSVQMREMYYFIAYAGDIMASNSYGYSVEAYCKSCVDYGNAAMADMGLKCIYYGDSACAYFNP